MQKNIPLIYFIFLNNLFFILFYFICFELKIYTNVYKQLLLL